jgi:hypothetical protein
MDSINDHELDHTKCVPIVMGTKSSDQNCMCDTWKTVEKEGSAINYPCNWATIPSTEKTEIEDLVYFA